MSEQATAPLPDDWESQDSHECFFLGLRLAKEAVAAGEPLPAWLRSARGRDGEAG